MESRVFQKRLHNTRETTRVCTFQPDCRGRTGWATLSPVCGIPTINQLMIFVSSKARVRHGCPVRVLHKEFAPLSVLARRGAARHGMCPPPRDKNGSFGFVFRKDTRKIHKHELVVMEILKNTLTNSYDALQ